MNENYLEVNDLTKKFKTGAGVFDVNFKIKKGEIVGFVGPNGTGKTTTIRLIFGLLKKDSGEVLLNGEDILKNNNLTKLAFFPDQNNYPQNYKIQDFIIYCGETAGLKRKEAIERSNEILKSLNLFNYKKQSFKKLSAGMQKRALLASVLVTNPEMIILDEPTSNLDVSSRIEFMNLLMSLSKVEKVTIIITSHIISELEDVIDHLLIMSSGKIVYDNEFDKEKEKIQEIYSRFIKDSMIDSLSLNEIYQKNKKRKGDKNET